MPRTTTKRQRRPKGTGCYTQRPDGLWQFRADVGINPTTGKRKRRCFYAKSKSDLARKVADETARSGGTIRPAAVGTVGAILDDWLANKADKHGRPWRRSTCALNRTMVDKHLKPLVGNWKLATFDGKAVGKLYQVLRDTPIPGEKQKRRTASVVFRAGVCAATAFEFWRKQEPWRVNPFAGNRLSHDDGEVLTLQGAEADRFIAACHGDRLESLWVMLITAGLRLGEALALEWRNVDLDRRTVDIRRASTEVNGEIAIGKPKTEASKRLVSLTKTAVESLRRRRVAWEAEGHGSEAIFTEANGTKLYRGKLRGQYFDSLLKRAGLPKVSIHSLRHTAATRMADKGVPLHTILTILGQTKPMTALEHYLRSSREEGQRAAAAADRSYQPKRTKGP